MVRGRKVRLYSPDIALNVSLTLFQVRVTRSSVSGDDWKNIREKHDSQDKKNISPELSDVGVV